MTRETDEDLVTAIEAAYHTEELATLVCGAPGCTDCNDILEIDQSCHPGAGLRVAYLKEWGVTVVHCRVCDKGVVVFKIASLPKEKLQ